MPVDDLAAAAETLRRLHRPGTPLVLPNAWDVTSARLVVDAGFPVVATTSAAVARSLGFADNDTAPADAMFAAIERIAAAVEVPVTADMEAGYSLTPAELVERLLAAGAVGLNLEDTDHHGGGDPRGVVDAGRHAERLAAVKEAGRAAGVDVVLNARVDVHVRQVGPPESRLEEGLRRARLYLEAGADCVYPITVVDEETIVAFVQELGAPVNAMSLPDALPLARLAELGVARISFGSGLARAALAATRAALDGIAAGDVERLFAS